MKRIGFFRTTANMVILGAPLRRTAMTMLFLVGATAFGATPTVEEILRRMDDLYRSESSRATVEMTITTPNWERTMRLDMWSQGMDKTFIRVLSPKKDADTATLRIKNEMWNYFPKSDKVMKVPPSMMMGSWMGSDFTNDDLVRESSYVEDYTAELVKSDAPETYAVALIPKRETVTVWGKIVMVVRERDLLPVCYDFYDEKGGLTRRMAFSDIKSFGKRTLPAVMELTPLKKKGNRTVVRYVSAEFDSKVDANTFTLRNLQRK